MQVCYAYPKFMVVAMFFVFLIMCMVSISWHCVDFAKFIFSFVIFITLFFMVVIVVSVFVCVTLSLSSSTLLPHYPIIILMGHCVNACSDCAWWVCTHACVRHYIRGVFSIG